jgi:hypothetical protein
MSRKMKLIQSQRKDQKKKKKKKHIVSSLKSLNSQIKFFLFSSRAPSLHLILPKVDSLLLKLVIFFCCQRSVIPNATQRSESLMQTLSRTFNPRCQFVIIPSYDSVRRVGSISWWLCEFIIVVVLWFRRKPSFRKNRRRHTCLSSLWLCFAFVSSFYF